MGLFGREWRAQLFCTAHVVDIGTVTGLVLLLGLGAVKSAVTRLFELLNKRDFRARAAHPQAWVRINAQPSPGEELRRSSAAVRSSHQALLPMALSCGIALLQCYPC